MRTTYEYHRTAWAVSSISSGVTPYLSHVRKSRFSIIAVSVSDTSFKEEHCDDAENHGMRVPSKTAFFRRYQ